MGWLRFEPLEDWRVRVDVIVFAPSVSDCAGSKQFGILNVAVRRLFIKKFLTADAIRLNGVRYKPGGFIRMIATW